MLKFGVEGGGGEDDVEKVGRTSGKILATPLLKPEKTTGVLRNVLIICAGSHFQGSTDQESFPWLPVNKRVTTVVSGRSVKCNAIFAVFDLSALGFKTFLLVCSPSVHTSANLIFHFSNKNGKRK